MHWDCKRSGGRFKSLKADCTDFTVHWNSRLLVPYGQQFNALSIVLPLQMTKIDDYAEDGGAALRLVGYETNMLVSDGNISSIYLWFEIHTSSNSKVMDVS